MWFLKRFRKPSSGATSTLRKSRDLYLASGFGLFLFGMFCSFYLAFPDVILKQRLVHELEARLPIKVELAESGLQPLLTLTGKQLVVGFAGQPASLFQADSFHVDPKWLSLLTGDPGLEGELRSSAGRLAFGWLRSGALTLSGVNLPLDVPLATNPAMRITGVLAAGQVTSAVLLQKNTASHLELTLEQLAVHGLGVLASSSAGLRLGKLSLLVTGQGTSLSIARLETSEGELVISGEGTLMLVMAKPQNSRINLNLSVRAGKQADPTLVSLLELAGTQQPDGSRKLHLSGTLANPIIR